MPSRVTLLAGPTFLHINTLARSAGTTPRKLKSVFYLKGPFIYYELGGAGGGFKWVWGRGHQKKSGPKGGALYKIIREKGVSRKIFW